MTYSKNHNVCVLNVSPEPMFKYNVTLVDYNLGGYEYVHKYTGTNREKAFAAFKEAKAWMGMAEVKITVLGREWQKDSRLRAKLEAKSAAEAEAQAELEAAHWTEDEITYYTSRYEARHNNGDNDGDEDISYEELLALLDEQIDFDYTDFGFPEIEREEARNQFLEECMNEDDLPF